MEPNRRPRNPTLTADQVSDMQDDMLAVQTVLSGRLDDRIKEFRAERDALGAARTIKEMQDEQASLQTANTLLKSQGDAIRAETAAARAEALRERERLQGDIAEATKARDAVLAENRAAGERLVAEAREAAQAILEGAREVDAIAKAAVAEQEARLAEIKAQAKTAQGELSRFREALATEKARAAQALGFPAG